MYEDRTRFVWTANDESNFYVDFLENKRVGSDAKATADRRQDNGTVEVQIFLSLKLGGYFAHIMK